MSKQQTLPPDAAPTVPAPNPVAVPTTPTAAAAPVTAASLVDDDKDVFPNVPVPSDLEAPPGIDTPASDNNSKKKSKRGGARPGAGRPPKTEGASTGPVFGDKPPEPAKPPVDYMALSAMMFGMTTNVLAQTLGPEWLPRPGTPEQQRPGLAPIPGMPGEDQMIVPVLAKYLESKQMPDLPPGIMLTLVLAAYAAPRFREPATKEKIKGVWFWVRSKFGRKNRGPMAVVSETTRQKQESPGIKEEL